jgi:ADP-ribose pyrophosphatase YjhB (NUDIX family)
MGQPCATPWGGLVELVERAVVACFLRYGDKICLLKRSQAVGSARGRWHCVSGFVEPGIGPLEQALAEIGEETGLQGRAIRLAAAPAPIRVERPTQGWVWIIYPFLFDTASPDLRLDWEHDAYRWIEPSELDATDCVPWLSLVWSALSP